MLESPLQEPRLKDCPSSSNPSKINFITSQTKLQKEKNERKSNATSKCGALQTDHRCRFQESTVHIQRKTSDSVDDGRQACTYQNLQSLYCSQYCCVNHVTLTGLMPCFSGTKLYCCPFHMCQSSGNFPVSIVSLLLGLQLSDLQMAHPLHHLVQVQCSIHDSFFSVKSLL